MPRGRLAERAQVREQRRDSLLASCRVVAVDEIPERIERDVLAECHPEREASAVDRQPLPDRVEGETEDRSIDRVESEPGRTPTSSTREGFSEHGHVGIVAAEESPVEGLEKAPDRRGEGACRGRAQG